MMFELPIALLAAMTAGLAAHLMLGAMIAARGAAPVRAEASAGFLADALVPAFEPAARAWFPRLSESAEHSLVLAGRPWGKLGGSGYVGYAFGRSLLIGAGILLLCLVLRVGVISSLALGLVSFFVSAGYAWNALSSALSARKGALDREFPFFFDFVVMTKEAGATLSQSIELFVAATPRTRLARDMGVVLENARGPRGSIGALRDYIDTCASESGRNALSTIVEAEPLGAESGTMLRDAALDMRQQRNERAKSAAESLRTRILLPIMVMLVGIIIIVLSGSLPNFMFGFG